MKKRRRHSPEQIIKKLRDADAMLAAGKSIGEVLQALEVSEATLSRWRSQYGGMKSLIANDLLESIVLFFEHLQSFGFLALHAAVLALPARQGCLTDFERLQHFANALAGREHRVGVTQLLDDLLG